MKILIIGGGGREYAIGKKINQSPKCEKLFFLPGNAGTKDLGKNIFFSLKNFSELIDFVKNEKIDLTIVGPENPLSDGIVDAFERENLKIFGVNQENSQFESSKDYTKSFLKKHSIPTADYKTFNDYESSVEYLKEARFPIVLKADGLCFGKGVVIAEDFKEGKSFLEEIFVDETMNSDAVVIEEFLDGRELSVICFVSHDKIFPLEFVRDYKKIGEGDTGENTGGVGAVSPIDDITEDEKKKINQVIKEIENGLVKDKAGFTGILFIGFMLTEEANVLEFNVRFGDPETQLLMERLDSDLLELILKTIDGSLKKEDIEFSDDTYVGVVLCSENYPKSSETGRKITLGDLKDTILIPAGMKIEGGQLVTSGGRVAMLLAKGDSIKIAREKVYERLDNSAIDFNGMYYRKDIGQ